MAPRNGRQRPGGNPPTINDVARRAGVSKGTVSHVISGRLPVAAATRARVETAIAALAYRPAETARSLTARKRSADQEGRIDAAVPRLTSVGFVSVDYTASLDRLPRRQERRLAATVEKSIGGPAANVAAIAAALGPPFPVAASLIAGIGVDQDSDWAAAELAHRRVDLIVPPERREGRLNRALVLVESNGARTIIHEPSRLADVDVRQFVEATNPKGLRWCLHLEGYHVPRQSEAVAAARRKGFQTSMQATGLPPDWLAAHAEAVLGSYDIVVLQRESLSGFSGRPCDSEAALVRLTEAAAGTSRPDLIALTLGEHGAVAVTRDGSILRATAPPARVVDTTGAGDTFVGCLLTAWLNGCPPDKALRLACIAGSLQVTRFGAQEIRPSATELLALEAGTSKPAPRHALPTERQGVP